MNKIKARIKRSIAVREAMLLDCSVAINEASNEMHHTIKKGKKILWCGNGGSAADAQHMAAELMGGLVSHKRPPIPSIALTTDSSFLTAWTNDISYETVFSRQIEGIGNKGDLLVAISTSGNSENVIRAVIAAKEKSITSVSLTGNDGGKLAKVSDIDICIPSNNTQLIQEGHLLTEHILCEILEQSMINISKNY